MSEVFGSCGDKFVTWDDTLFDENGRPMVRFTSAEGDETLDICLNPVKGAVVVTEDGTETEIEVIDGVLHLGDIFGSGVVSEDGSTLTATFPGQEPVDICLKPVKTVTGDGVDNDDPANPVITQGTVSDQENGVSGIVTDYQNNSCEFLKAVAYKPSSATPSDESGDGVVDTNTITTSDGAETPVCLNPLKTVVTNDDGTFSAVDAQGNVVNTWGDTVIPADGSANFQVVDPEGNITLPDGSTAPAVDGQGNPIPADEPVLNIFDGDGAYVGSKSCMNVDTFGAPSVAEAGVTDFLGDPVPEGNQILTLPGNLVVCLPTKQKIFPVVMGCYECGEAGLVVTDGSKPAYLGQTVQPSQWELTDGTNTVTGSGNTTLDYSTLDPIGPWTLTQSTQANDDPECVQSCSKQIPSCVEVEQFCGLLPEQEEVTNPFATDTWVDNNDGTFTNTFPTTGMVVTWGISRVDCIGTTQPISNCDPNTWTHSATPPNPQAVGLTEGQNAFAETGGVIWPIESGVEYDAFFRIDALPDKGADSCEGKFALESQVAGLGVGFTEGNPDLYYTSVRDIQNTGGSLALNPTANMFELTPGEWTVDRDQVPPEGGIGFTWESFAIGDVLSYSGTAFRSDAMAMRLVSTTCRQAVCADVVGGEVLSAVDGEGEAVEDLSTVELGELK